ncbi:hypothetical protein ACHAXN_008809 [Cyclotella atomus]
MPLLRAFRPLFWLHHIDLFLELGNVFGIISQHDAFTGEFFAFAGFAGGVSFGLASGGDADLAVGAFADDEVAVEEVGGTALGCVELGDGRGFGGWRGGRDVGGDPGHGRVVVIVLGVGLSGGGAVGGARAAPPGLFFGAGGGA